MPAARGVKRAASKTSASTASTAPKNKKKRGVVQLEIPTAPTKKGQVFTCGQGDVGQLGLGEDVIETTKFKPVTALGDNIVAISAGGMHTIALDSSGKVWTYGCNDEGALGRNTSGDSDEGTPKKVTLPAKAVAVTAGDSHSAALLENGDVYAWGSFRDSHGSMGLVMRGREGKPSKEPIKIDIGEQAADIASGGDHLVILSTSGGVYTMGCGEQGQLGRVAQRSASRDARHGFSALLVPARVPVRGGAARVWAGSHATFLLAAADDKVYAFGLNNYGQLGVTGTNRKTALYTPTESDAFRVGGNWRRVACGQHHTLALDDSGQVYAIGRCEYGRLGLGERAGDAEILEPVPTLQDKKCISIAAGTCNSFAVTDTGEVYAWGMGSEGQLGTGACEDAAEPARAQGAARAGVGARGAGWGAHAPLSVAAGGQHTVLLCEDKSPQKEPTPTPESETGEQSTEASAGPPPPPRHKRIKKDQEEEISSTSAPASDGPATATATAKPEKVNGDEKKSTPMDVDQTDNTDNTDTDSQDKKEPETEDKQEVEESKAADKAETTDTSSQDTTESETKSQDSDESKDVDMKPEVNGTDTSEKVDAKTVEVSSNPLTSTA